MNIANLNKFKIKSTEIEKLVETNWVNFNGLLLKPNVVVCINLSQNDEPIFGLITNILKKDTKYFLCLQAIDTLFFNVHFCAYEVKISDFFYVKDLDSFTYFHASCISKNASGKKFIIWDY